MTAPFPWTEAMRLGLAVLRLPPREFWAMTPRELAAAAGAGRKGEAPGREQLEALMARFPDGGGKDGG